VRIDSVYIDDWKNLRKFEIDLDESQLTSVLIGANATGKSHLIEAIVRIFRNLDLGEKPDFSYRIRYEVRGHQVEIDASPRLLFEELKRRKEMDITVDGVRLTQREFERQKDQLLPSNVFA
jgi:predicted ATP-dependent endonuclease of OLD family